MFPIKYKTLGKYYIVSRNQYPGGFRRYAHKDFEGIFYHVISGYDAWKGKDKYKIENPAIEKYYYN